MLTIVLTSPGVVVGTTWSFPGKWSTNVTLGILKSCFDVWIVIVIYNLLTLSKLPSEGFRICS